ncbi:hypothetical protein ES703_85178 [subsurface metagenome]
MLLASKPKRPYITTREAEKIEIPEEVRKKAKKSLDRMLEV